MLLACTLVLLLAHAPAAPAAPVAPARQDDPLCPPIEADTWINHVGQAPTLESLRGRPVLIGEYHQARVHHYAALREEYGARGLVVLVVLSGNYTEERDDRDALYAAPFPIGFGCPIESKLDELVDTEYPTTYLVDGEGRVVWSGRSHDVPAKELRTILRSAPRPGKREDLAWRGSLPDADPKALELAAAGELARALDLASRDGGDEDDGGLRAALLLHVEELVYQIDAAITRRDDLAAALAAAEALHDQLGDRPEGARVRVLATRVRVDDTLEGELDAEEDLLDLIDFEVWRDYGRVKSGAGSGHDPPIAKAKRPQLARLVRKHEGTAAARRAAVLLSQLE